MSIRPIALWFTLLVLAAGRPAPGQAAPAPASTQPAPAASVADWPWHDTRSFTVLGPPGDTLLSGIRNTATWEFQVRRDRLVRAGALELAWTPSPALIPVLSHVRVYLNDALMAVVPIKVDDPGQPQRARVPLDARLVADFNRVRLEFVGHYTDICEDPTHSSLWVNVSGASRVELAGQPLVVRDDLANFPLPFFDARDTSRLVLPVLFAAAPNTAQQQAAAVLASYFGSLAGWWRQASFPVSYGQLPASGHVLVLATNGHFPPVIGDHAPVDGPRVELASVPGAPERKLLLVLGRDDADLERAAAGIAAGNALFRGTSVRVDEVRQLAPRVPYDAPNWVRTDRVVRFGELQDYPGQLQADGISPQPIVLHLNLPPDLFIWHNQGIPLNLRYRYTPPTSSDESRLLVAINDEFVSSFPLRHRSDGEALGEVRLPVLGTDAGNGDGKLLVPALKLGERNDLRFDFSFASVMGSAQRDHCQSMLPPNLKAVIEDDSTIDLSGFHHYIAMPNLAAFALSGFPFTRMADLSETQVLMPKAASAMQVEVLLDAIGGLGAQSGYPAYGLRIGDDWAAIRDRDADLLVIADLPPALRDDPRPGLLVERQRDLLRRGQDGSPRHAEQAARSTRSAGDPVAREVAVGASAPLAAITGFQSPFHPQRSVVVLAGADDADLALLGTALGDIGQRGAVAGAVAILRSSGVDSQFVGAHYYVGSLPWWWWLWFHLADHPLLLAVLATLAALLAAFVLWRILHALARRRLGQGG